MKFDIFDFEEKDNFDKYIKSASENISQLLKKTGKGNNFLGWLDLPFNYNKESLVDICKTAIKFQRFDIVIVIGIGGSYLGSKAVIEALKPQFGILKPEIIFAGHTLSEDYYSELIDYLKDKSFGLVIISKSGTTTEPAIAFRILLNELKKSVPKEKLAERVVTITDSSKGALKTISVNENYKSYIIPDDVGGRFSVLTPVGLLPIAIAGFDISALLNGAVDARQMCAKYNENNLAVYYAAFRNLMYKSGKKIELLINFNLRLNFIAEWWKQLFGESEGKELKGIFPASASFTTDLHSLGQYIQQGERHLFETAIVVENNSKLRIEIPFDENNLDELNYISLKNIEFINQKAREGTLKAHLDGGVPNCKISIEKLDEYNIGYLLYFFEFACAISGYMLEINPFDQPGVENYKKNMFELLGKK
ncbi:MAG: glucose-6-phosphate isomerase [Bacteroidales bacterium]|jgi:glucose-6-phosphate isomerase|nr:glucose-6-phosphate isomerase [Bacteroidales bacterium]